MEASVQGRVEGLFGHFERFASTFVANSSICTLDFRIEGDKVLFLVCMRLCVFTAISVMHLSMAS